MLLTEDEAKKLPCPMMRHCVNSAAVTSLGEHPIYEHSPCLASGCPAWRWVVGPIWDTQDGYPVGYSRGTSDAKKWRGFCGLGGRPEC